MGREFPGYIGGLKPSFKFLSDKAVIVQAWKKAHAYMRRHNWYSDNLELDLSCINLEKLYLEIQAIFADPGRCVYEPAPMRVVPAPKACGDWNLNEVNISVPENFGIRPLAHLTVRDQVIAMMFLMCLANIIEKRQGVPLKYSSNHPEKVAVSYGNRLICDVADDCDEEMNPTSSYEHDGSFLWGNSETYNRYYKDYQAFIARPSDVVNVLAGSKESNGLDLYVVALDLSKFYDRIDRTELARKVRKEVRAAGMEDEAFLFAFESLLKWKWDDCSRCLLSKYQESLSDKVYDGAAWLNGRAGLPQGLAASGFFANIYLLDFDDCIKEIVAKRNAIQVGDHRVRIFDYCRYVDDMRFVVGIENNFGTIVEVQNQFVSKIQALLNQTSPGQYIERKKTEWNFFKRDNRKDFLALRMSESKNRTSDAIDEQSAYELLKINQDLWHEAKIIKDVSRDDCTPQIGSIPLTRNRARIKADTVERFAANNWRCAYKVLSSILPAANSTVPVDEIKGECPKTVLDALTDEFCEEVILRWIKDPSKVRILRIAFDLRPNAEYLRMVLEMLLRLIDVGGDAQLCGYYVASELFRAGAIETGFQYLSDDEPLHEAWLSYRTTLHNFVERFIDDDVPWYLANQLMLFEFTYNAEKSRLVYPCPQNCDSIYRECYSILSNSDEGDCRNVSLDAVILANAIARPSAICGRYKEMIFNLKEASGIEWRKCLAFIPPEELAQVLCVDAHMAIDQISPKLVANKVYSLHEISDSEVNPFLNEVSVARLGVALSRFFKDHQVSQKRFYTTETLGVSCLDWGEISNAQNKTDLLRVCECQSRNILDRNFLFQPEPWEPKSFIKVAQIGRILRAVVMSGDEYSAMRRCSLTVARNQGEEGPQRFFGVRTSWLKRRYGLYFDRTCLGGVHVAFSPWFTEVLSSLLAWPGSFCSKRYEKLSFRELERVFLKRLGILSQYPNLERGTVLVPVDVDAGKFRMGTIRDQQIINIAIVQNLKPDAGTLMDASIRDSKESHRIARRHLSDMISMLRVTFRTHNGIMQDRKSINLIVFPELAVYERDITFLKRFADKMNCMVFCGIVYCRDPRADKDEVNAGIINAGIWIIPQHKDNEERRVFIELLQGKGNLAQEERSVQNLSAYRPVQWIIKGVHRYKNGRQKDVWSLTGSICYDATDIRLAAALRDHVDCYIVSAFNKDVGLFDVMAESWRYHMYGHMVVANTGIFGGSTIQAPYDKPYERIIAHAHGGQQAQILLARLNLHDFSNATKERKSKQRVKSSPAGYQGRRRDVELFGDEAN